MAEKSSSNSCAVVVPQQRCGPPLNIWPDLSGDLLFSAMSLSLPPVFSVLPFSPLCGLGARSVSSLPAVEAGFLPQHVFSPTQPCKTRHWSQKG